MSIKLKALGLGLLAMMAVGAFAAMNAGATTNGEFLFGSNPTFVTGIQDKGTTDTVHFRSDLGGNTIGCDVAQYTGKHEGTLSTQSLTITPAWSQCYTTTTAEAKWDVHENGCTLIFTSRKEPEKNDATVDVECPTGKAIVITHPDCEITIAKQTVGGAAGNGVTYTNKTEPAPAWITMNVKVTLTTSYHKGLCTIFGTHHTDTMEGAVTVTGYSNAAHTTRTAISAK